MAGKRDVRVEIFDHVYHLSVGGEDDAEQVQRAAAYVDSKMRAVSSKIRDVDSQRLAVLAALHIADEMQSLQGRFDALATTVEKRSAALSRKLDIELRDAG